MIDPLTIIVCVISIIIIETVIPEAYKPLKHSLTILIISGITFYISNSVSDVFISKIFGLASVICLLMIPMTILFIYLDKATTSKN